jgi:hypothetical protein
MHRVSSKAAQTAASSTAVGKVPLLEGERVVFTEEKNPQNYLKLKSMKRCWTRLRIM